MAITQHAVAAVGPLAGASTTATAPPQRLAQAGRLRVDQLELDPEVQAEVAGIWEQIDTDNLKTLADFEGYRQEILQLFGFGVDGVDYDADVDPEVAIPQLVE